MNCPNDGLLRSLLGSKANSNKFTAFLTHQGLSLGDDVNVYPDCVYVNWKARGLSIVFSPLQDYKPKYSTPWKDLDMSKLSCSAIDLYNAPSDMAQRRAKAGNRELFASYDLPLLLKGKKELELKSDTNGRRFIEAFGEPSRKGGENIGIWLVSASLTALSVTDTAQEWVDLGVKAEIDARGNMAWERAADETWTTVTLFPKGDLKGEANEGEHDDVVL